MWISLCSSSPLRNYDEIAIVETRYEDWLSKCSGVFSSVAAGGLRSSSVQLHNVGRFANKLYQ